MNLTLPNLTSDTTIIWKRLPILFLGLVTLVCFVLYWLVPDNLQTLVLLLPAVIAFGFIVLVRPEIAMYLSIAYVPFESPDFVIVALPAGLSVSKILGALLIGTFIFNVLFRRHQLRMLDDLQDVTLLLLAAMLIFSAIFSEYQSDSFSATIRMVRIFAFYFAVKNLITSKYHIKNIMWLMFIGGTIGSIWGINEFLETRLVRIHDIRVRGIMLDANDYALMTIFVLFISIHLLSLVKNRPIQLMIIVGTIINISGIILSGSRGGFIALVVTGLLYIMSQKNRWQLLIAVVVLVGISIPVWPSSIQARIGLSDDTTDALYLRAVDRSTNRRLSYIDFSLVLIAQRPLLGIGYGTFANYYPRSEFAQYDNPLTETGLSRVSHNTYLEIATGAGLLGLLFYLAHLAVVLKSLHYVSTHSKPNTIIQAGSRALFYSLIAFMIASVFLSIEHFNYLWMTSALSAALYYIVKNDNGDDINLLTESST